MKKLVESGQLSIFNKGYWGHPAMKLPPAVNLLAVAHYLEVLDFQREAELDRVGCFAYSPVDGAAANDLPGALPDEVREERRRRFMEVQAEISLRKLARRIGRIEDVIIDEEPDEDGVAVGRTKSDAPDIDGVCYVTTDRKLVPGDIVPVRITANEEHDLVGREVVA